jgi:hypothetical protein
LSGEWEEATMAGHVAMVMTKMVQNFDGTLTKMTRDHAKEQVLVLAVLKFQLLLAQWKFTGS